MTSNNVPDFIPDGILLDVGAQRRAELLLREADLFERLACYRRELAQIITDNPRALVSDKGYPWSLTSKPRSPPSTR